MIRFLWILQFTNFCQNVSSHFQTFSPSVQHFTNFFDIQTLRKYLATIDGFLQKIPFFASKTLAKNALCLQFSGVMCLRDAIISALVKKKLRVREEEEQKKTELQSEAAAQHVPHVMRG